MKKLCVVSVAFTLALSACAWSMPVDEIGRIFVDAEGSNFQYWNEDAPSLQALKAYVKDVTNPESPNFIPPVDRICVSDLDGTFYGELAPFYMEWMMFFHRIYEDPTYTPSAREKAFADECLAAAKAGKVSTELDAGEDHVQSHSFEGMTIDDFDAYAEAFLKTPLDGLTNCTFGEAYYLPMVEVIRYLQSNGFTFYVVSAADRQLIRVALRAIPSINPSNVIGTDSKPIAKRQGFLDGLHFVFESEDELARGPYLVTDNKMEKVSAIYKEIGKRPVIGLGNSGSDTSMLNYARFNPKYKGFAMGVACDDGVRDFGGEEKAKSFKETCKRYDWVCVSMRDDWKTIYGEGVEKTERKFRP